MKWSRRLRERRLLQMSTVTLVVSAVLVIVGLASTAATQSARGPGSTSTSGSATAASNTSHSVAGAASAPNPTASSAPTSNGHAAFPPGNSASLAAKQVRPIVAPPAIPTGATRISALPGSTSLTVDVILKPADPQGLADYARQVSTPGSPLYRHFLPKQAFASRFGPSLRAVSAVQAALRSRGLSPGRISADHLTIPVRATADTVTRGLSTRFSRYRLQNGRIAFANTTSPELPAAVASDVQDISGLDDLVEAQPGALLADAAPAAGHATAAAGSGVGAPQVVTGGPQPCAAASTTSVIGDLTADQVASAYGFPALYGQGDEGQGQTVAVIEAEPNLASDIATYQSCYGTTTSVDYVSVDGGPGVSGAGSGEAALDIEQIIGLAPKADVVVYQSPGTLDGLYHDFQSAISADTAQVISTSWGTCEGFTSNNPEFPGNVVSDMTALFAAENTLFELAAAQGQSVVAASGDDGSEGCAPWQSLNPGFASTLAVGDPAAQPFVTGVGGTSLADVTAPSSETVWNSYHAGGGGISNQWSMPSYQSGAPAGVGVVNAGSSGSPCLATTGDCREVPDVSADADPYTGYSVFWSGGWHGIGGTSAGAPLWGALLALTNASSACGGNPVGFANPTLYATAADDPGAFNDITTGNNDYTGANSGTFPARTGYDMASGLGTPTANLPSALCDSTQPGAPTITSKSSALIGLGAPSTVTVTTAGASAPTITESGPLPSGMTLTDHGNGTATIDGIPSQSGSFPVVLTAALGSSSTAQSFILSVGTSPVITSAPSATFANNTDASFDLTASGSPTPSFTVAGTLPQGMVLTSTGVLINVAASAGSGIYPVTVTASNGLASATQAFTVVEDGRPAFTSRATASFALHTAGTFTVTTSAAPVAALTEVGALPAGMTFVDHGNGTATLSGAPMTAGSFPLTFTASNPDGAPIQSFNLQILSSVVAPHFTSPANVTFTVDKKGAFHFAATGSPAPTFSVVSGFLPQSMVSGELLSITSTGLLAGRPYWVTGGIYHVVVEADNGVAAPAFQSFTLTVDDRPVVYADGYGGTFNSYSGNTLDAELGADLVLGQPDTLTLRADGYPTPTFSESGQLPTGTVFVDHGDGTASITGTPTEAGNFDPVIVATNAAGVSTGNGPAGSVVKLAVAPAVAPSFLSPDHGFVDTGPTLCGEYTSIAAGFPAPQIVETGVLPYPEELFDTPADAWDPSSASVGNNGCTSPGPAGGTYPLTLVASNSAGSVTQQLGLTLTTGVGPKPTLEGPNTSAFTAGAYGATLIRETDGSQFCDFESPSTLPAGLTLDEDGLLYGVAEPGSEGTYPLTMNCLDSTGVLASRQLTVTVGDVPTITSPSASTFALGDNSPFTVTTAGTPAPALSETGALPPGTSFVDNGSGTATISGAPAQVGTYPITISATNSLGTTNQALTLSVGTAQPPVITSAGTVTVHAGGPAAVQLAATGAPSPVFSVDSGSLPPGLTLSSGGLISGTATVPGHYAVIVEASNGVLPAATQNLAIDAVAPPGVIDIVGGGQSTTYSGGPPLSVTIESSGYPLPSFTASGLPPGVAIVNVGPVPGSPNLASATVSGTPTQLGTFTTTLTATNALGTQVATYVIHVTSLHLQITTASLPPATTGVPYSAGLALAGGTAPYSWSLAPGSTLPKGLKLNKSTAVLSGTPAKTDSGTYSFSVEVVDSLKHTAVQALSIAVRQPAPTITSITPTSGSAGGGQVVKIHGLNLGHPSSVLFGTVAAATVVVNSAGTVITVHAPAEPPGSVVISVTTPGGVASSPTAYVAT
jgi:hypothetical protein